MGIETAALIVAGVAAGATAYNTYETNKRTERETVRAIEAQGKRDRQADESIRESLAGLRASTPEAEKAAAMDRYLTTARSGQAKAEEGLASFGDVSERFTSGAGAAAGDIATGAATRAGQMAVIDAANNQRVREGLDFSRLGLKLGEIGRGSASDAYLSDLRMKRAAQRDPWIDAFASAAKGYATSGGTL